MSLAQIAVDKKPVTYFILVLVVIAGISSYFELGQLEDPAFTVLSLCSTVPSLFLRKCFSKPSTRDYRIIF